MDSSDKCVLDIIDILCLGAGHTRPLVEGAEVLQCAILSIGKVAATEDSMEIFGLVMQSSYTDQSPHGVTIKIKLENGSKKLTMYCTCIGGSAGRCKHSIAVAMRLIKLPASALESVSCTDLRQRWGKPQMEAFASAEFAGVELKQQCHFRPNTYDEEELTAIERGYCLQKMLNAAKPSDELPIFMSHSRHEQEDESAVRLPTLHKSLKTALRKMTSASTETPKPKPLTKYQLKEIEKARQAQAKSQNKPQPTSSNGCDQLPSAQEISPQDALQGEPGVDLLEILQGAIGKAKESSVCLPTDNDFEKSLRQDLSDLSDILEGLVPRLNEIALEEQEPLAQSTPKQSKTPLGSMSLNIPQSRSGQMSAEMTTTPKKWSFPEKKKRWEEINKARLFTPQFSAINQEHLFKAALTDICTNLDFNCDFITNSDDQLYFDSRIKLLSSESVKVCLETLQQSESNANGWHDFRRNRFSASSAYSIFCRKESVDNNEFWVGHLQALMVTQKRDTWTMRRGLTDEPHARKCYETVTGKQVHILGAFAHPMLPQFCCSPDGIVVTEGILIEIKSVELGIFQSASQYVFELDFIKKSKENSNPEMRKRHKYYGQVQMCMALLSLSLCHLVIYSSHDDSIFIVEVPFDKEFVKEYFTKLSLIYFKYKLPLLREEGNLAH